MGQGSLPATEKSLQKAGMTIDDIDWLENDLVTPTFKNQRIKLTNRYKEKH